MSAAQTTGLGRPTKADRFRLLPLLVLALTLPVIAGCPDLGVETPEDGVWHGYMSDSDYEVVTFNVESGVITTDNSTLDNDAAMIVKVPYSNVTITSYFYDNVDLSDNEFSFSRGDVTSASGKLTVEGIFTGSDQVAGSVSHEVDSFEWRGQLSYEWSAHR